MLFLGSMGDGSFCGRQTRDWAVVVERGRSWTGRCHGRREEMGRRHISWDLFTRSSFSNSWWLHCKVLAVPSVHTGVARQTTLSQSMQHFELIIEGRRNGTCCRATVFRSISSKNSLGENVGRNGFGCRRVRERLGSVVRNTKRKKKKQGMGWKVCNTDPGKKRKKKKKCLYYPFRLKSGTSCQDTWFLFAVI